MSLVAEAGVPVNQHSRILPAIVMHYHVCCRWTGACVQAIKIYSLSCDVQTENGSIMEGKGQWLAALSDMNNFVTSDTRKVL